MCLADQSCTAQEAGSKISVLTIESLEVNVPLAAELFTSPVPRSGE